MTKFTISVSLPAEKDGDPNKGAVMLIIYNKDNNLNLLLIKRQENLKTHPGQISFPGGTLLIS